MIERVVIRGIDRSKVDNLLNASQFELGKVFPIWDTHVNAAAGWVVYEFSVLYPAERELLQALPGALYFSRISDLEDWFDPKADTDGDGVVTPEEQESFMLRIRRFLGL